MVRELQEALALRCRSCSAFVPDRRARPVQRKATECLGIQRLGSHAVCASRARLSLDDNKPGLSVRLDFAPFDRALIHAS